MTQNQKIRELEMLDKAHGSKKHVGNEKKEPREEQMTQQHVEGENNQRKDADL